MGCLQRASRESERRQETHQASRPPLHQTGLLRVRWQDDRPVQLTEVRV